jgi:glycosyltransferase involved in cell wall biosynthesis
MLADITPIVITRDESANIARTLACLTWAREVVVLDSGSSDDTLAKARQFPNVRIEARAFDHHAGQWNHAIANCGIATPWVLTLDADHCVEPELVDELRALDSNAPVAGYRIPFIYAIDGQRLRRSFYPAQVSLFRRERGHFRQEGHAQRLVLGDPIVDLEGAIVHDDRKPYAQWLASQRRYAALEAERLVQTPWSALRWRDRARRLRVLTPWLVPLYGLIVFGLWRDGRAGMRYVAERATAERLIAAALGQRSGPGADA